MRPATVIGAGLWSPGYECVDAWLTQRVGPEAQQPRCAIVDARLRRGTSLLTRMAINVVEQAARDAGIDLSITPTVFGSAHGEIRIAIDQLDMMWQGDGQVSPRSFKNSVHNTASSLLSIATGNRGFATAVAADGQTLAMALLEALVLLELGEPAVAVAVADEPLPEPFVHTVRYDALAAAFVLSGNPSIPGTRLSRLSRREVLGDVSGAVPPRLRHNPCLPALWLLEQLYSGESGTVQLEADGTQRWCVDVSHSP